jgi:UDP-3-O-[3-hydroxymyristoyl] glucosamine N-acyltransferase
MTVTLGELAVRFGCELRGDPAVTVDSVAGLSQAGPRSVSFLANLKYVTQLAGTRAGAVILDAKSAASSPVPALVVANPHATYARVATLLHPEPPLHPGVHALAVAEAGASIDASAQICAQAYVGEGARIGKRCFIGPGVIVERGAVIGDDSRFVAGAYVGHHVVFGQRCVVQPGAVIGGDGFGYAPDKGTWIKVPQIGGVNIGDDVEIGANTTIDRGALGDTVVEEGVKLDNLIMIAHNVRIGAHSALAACVAIAGSSVVGKRCILGGKVGLSGHITLCDDVVVQGTSFISHNITKPGVYSSALPSEEAALWRRIVGRIKRLDQMARRLRAVEKHLGLRAADRDSSED